MATGPLELSAEERTYLGGKCIATASPDRCRSGAATLCGRIAQQVRRGGTGSVRNTRLANGAVALKDRCDAL